MKIETIDREIRAIMKSWKEADLVREKDIMVVGCSTSEITGQRIGTAGSMEIAKTIYEKVKAFQTGTGCELAFQCCEHLNRAIVVDRSVQERYGWTVVNAIPQRSAGGSMATYAYETMRDPVLVEYITADYGMDIGDTMIGMHLKHVAVPLRFQQKSLGEAHVTFAKTRPKLIGGIRAIYE
ncbi:TIGR01440 family protein [Halalkalibacillus halophilus]|uniref:TIGR01440 family protein n=1 Tax=Halalkalibacillus halophilus TaxID=392827 RepID=UPI00040AB14D|nr:TIGR01440 family protein [Halalkalibacillus halophilus]